MSDPEFKYRVLWPCGSPWRLCRCGVSRKQLGVTTDSPVGAACMPSGD